MAKYSYQINPFTGRLDATSAAGGGKYPVTGVTGDQLLVTLPAGEELNSVYLRETAGSDVTIDLGTSAGGSQIYNGALVSANSETRLDIEDVYDWSSTYSVYISSGAWGGASLNIYILTKSVL